MAISGKAATPVTAAGLSQRESYRTSAELRLGFYAWQRERDARLLAVLAQWQSALAFAGPDGAGLAYETAAISIGPTKQRFYVACIALADPTTRRFVMTHNTKEPSPSDLSPEREYERLNPGGGGSPYQRQERGKANPNTTRDDGGAAIPGN